MRPEAGQILSSTLQLVKRIAEGGMGSVWIARHLVLEREVAVKIMSPQWAAMPNARTRFLREARLTACVDSPHVVEVVDCRLDEADEPYLVLELLRGETLEERVSKRGPLSVYELESVVTQACAGLSATHARGIVHRDIKPENVFLVAGAQTLVKLLDFGVAKPTRAGDCLDEDRLPAGTPRYMSPEHMFEPETTDERADLFSVGAVAYFALTGRSPFRAESVEELYLAIEAAAFARPSTIRPELPEALDAWFERALARDRDARFGSAEELASAFSEAVRVSSTPPPPPSAGDPLGGEDGPDRDGPELPIPGLRRKSPPRRVLAIVAALVTALTFLWQADGDVSSASASPEPPGDGGVVLDALP